eukprot:6547298-Pyramimonas_sp.AAC.1
MAEPRAQAIKIKRREDEAAEETRKEEAQRRRAQGEEGSRADHGSTPSEGVGIDPRAVARYLAD